MSNLSKEGQTIGSPSLQVQKRARNTTNHQRHPSLSLWLWPSLSRVLSAIPQDSHSAMWQWGSHCILGESLSEDPLWAQPQPPHPSPPHTHSKKISLGLLRIFPLPPGHHKTQNNRTHQHFHLHPWASSDTAAAAVRPLRWSSEQSLQLAHPLSPPVIRAQTEPDLESATLGVADRTVL